MSRQPRVSGACCLSRAGGDAPLGPRPCPGASGSGRPVAWGGTGLGVGEKRSGLGSACALMLSPEPPRWPGDSDPQFRTSADPCLPPPSLGPKCPVLWSWDTPSYLPGNGPALTWPKGWKPGPCIGGGGGWPPPSQLQEVQRQSWTGMSSGSTTGLSKSREGLRLRPSWRLGFPPVAPTF